MVYRSVRYTVHWSDLTFYGFDVQHTTHATETSDSTISMLEQMRYVFKIEATEFSDGIPRLCDSHCANCTFSKAPHTCVFLPAPAGIAVSSISSVVRCCFKGHEGIQHIGIGLSCSFRFCVQVRVASYVAQNVVYHRHGMCCKSVFLSKASKSVLLILSAGAIEMVIRLTQRHVPVTFHSWSIHHLSWTTFMLNTAQQSVP